MYKHTLARAHTNTHPFYKQLKAKETKKKVFEIN